MRVKKMHGCFYYFEGQFRRAIHRVWKELTGEIIRPVKIRYEADLLAARIFELRHGRGQTANVGILFEKATREYLENCNARGRAPKTLIQQRQQLLALKLKHVHQMTTKYVQDFLDKADMSGASKNRYISTYNRFNRWCRKTGYMREKLDIERFPERSEPKGKIVTPKELATLCDAAGFPFSKVIELGYHTGLRRGEIHYFWKNNWEQIDFKNRTATIPAAVVKNRSSRPILVFNKQAIAAMKALSGVRAYSNADAITRHFTRVCARAGLDFRFHDLRHTFVSRCALFATASQTARLVGHRDPRTTELIYTHYDIETLRKIVDAL